ncbi:MAG: RES family NAD+ phosphorylase [Ferruginibacter sp.]
MKVYRISNQLYSNDISGIGAKIYGSRWNSAGLPLLYTSAYNSLAMLEMLVHTNFEDYSIELDLMYIDIPDSLECKEIKATTLKQGWAGDLSYTKYIGDEFIKSLQTPLLKIPSAIIGEEYNYLANPLHNDFRKIKIAGVKSFRPDKRLLRTHE